MGGSTVQHKKEITNANTLKDIQYHFNFIPPFYSPALETPELLNSLWSQTKSCYLNNPLPADFKDYLFARLACYCKIPLGLLSHPGLLQPLSINPDELLQIVVNTAPQNTSDTFSQQNIACTSLFSEKNSYLNSWPGYLSEPGQALITGAIQLFIQPQPAMQQQMKFLLEPGWYQQLIHLLSYIKSCHFWIESQPEILFTLRGQLLLLLKENTRRPNDQCAFFWQALRQVEQVCESSPDGQLPLKSVPEATCRDRAGSAFLRHQVFTNKTWIEQLEAIVESITNTQGELVQFNKAACQLMGIQNYTEYMQLTPEQRANLLQLKTLLSLEYQLKATEYINRENEMALTKTITRLNTIKHLLQEKAAAEAKELALRATNQQMDTFLNMACHEIRTPLTTININVQLAQRSIQRIKAKQDLTTEVSKQFTSLQENLDRAHSQIFVLDRLVVDMLDLSRIQANKLEIRFEQADLIPIINTTIRDQRMINPDRIIKVTLPDVTTLPINADPDRIVQVLDNYLSNALKYSPPESEVTVLVQSEGDHVCTSVRDHGPGLSELDQEHIWERFYRVEHIEPTNGNGVSLGIGLFINRTIIERHQGQVGVQSAPGTGSTFWFRLPLLPG